MYLEGIILAFYQHVRTKKTENGTWETLLRALSKSNCPNDMDIATSCHGGCFYIWDKAVGFQPEAFGAPEAGQSFERHGLFCKKKATKWKSRVLCLAYPDWNMWNQTCWTAHLMFLFELTSKVWRLWAAQGEASLKITTGLQQRLQTSRDSSCLWSCRSCSWRVASTCFRSCCCLKWHQLQVMFLLFVFHSDNFDEFSFGLFMLQKGSKHFFISHACMRTSLLHVVSGGEASPFHPGKAGRMVLSSMLFLGLLKLWPALSLLACITHTSWRLSSLSLLFFDGTNELGFSCQQPTDKMPSVQLGPWSFNIHQLGVKDQRWVGWNLPCHLKRKSDTEKKQKIQPKLTKQIFTQWSQGAHSTFPISQVCRDLQPTLSTNTHSFDSFIPPSVLRWAKGCIIITKETAYKPFVFCIATTTTTTTPFLMPSPQALLAQQTCNHATQEWPFQFQARSQLACDDISKSQR